MMNLGYYNGQVVYMVQRHVLRPAGRGLRRHRTPAANPTGAQLVVDKVGTYPELNNYFEDHHPLPQDLPDGICETKASGYIDKPIPRRCGSR